MQRGETLDPYCVLMLLRTRMLSRQAVTPVLLQTGSDEKGESKQPVL